MGILFSIKNMDTAKGGAERVMSFVCSGMAEQGHDVTLLTCDQPKGKSYYSLDSRVKRISCGLGNSNEHATLGEMFERIFYFRKLLKQERPEVVVAFMHSMFVPMAFAAIGLKIPVIASEHIVPQHYHKRPIQFLLFIISTYIVDYITVLSRSVRKSYPFFVQKKMRIISNPVAISGSPKEKQRTDRKIILNVGRIDEQKDQKTLIRAFSKLADQHPNWDVFIFGEGPLETVLQEKINDLNMQDRIFLKGTTKNIAHEYACADIFALPSRYESFGLATAEAMSFSLPAVGFAECPGTNELIRNNHNGLLVSRCETDRVVEFSKALNTLMSDKQLRQKLGKEAKKTFEKFKPETVISQWEKLIDKASSKKE